MSDKKFVFVEPSDLSLAITPHHQIGLMVEMLVSYEIPQDAVLGVELTPLQARNLASALPRMADDLENTGRAKQ